MRLSTYARLLLCALFFASASFVHATEISNVSIEEINDSSAIISWTTDVNSDGTINYGLDPNVGLVRYPTFDRKSHTLTLEDLKPATTYYFRIVSSDIEGNRSTTGGHVFTTTSAQSTPDTASINDVEQKTVTERILSDLSQVTSREAIEAIADKVKDVAGDILKPPTILGATKVVADTTTAMITWTTDRESTSMVYLVPESDYNPRDPNPYTIAQGDPREFTTKHSVNVIGLEPSTVYHFKVVSEDNIGLSSETIDDTFRTKSILPTVTGVSVTRVQETSAVINWSTGNVLAKGVVEYRNMRTNETKTSGNAVFSTTQSLQLTGLEFGTRYTGIVTATNEGGETSTSDSFTFVTVRDVIPPAISKVNNESTLYPGEDTKIQTIMSWETDEPSVCQVFYTQGLVLPEGEEGEALPEELNPTTSHTQVVVGFAPATVYKFWMLCNDESENESRSEDFVLITPVKEKNIIDIILENFEGTFGWVKNIGG